MERKIGEIFERNGEWYQCLKSDGCRGCAFLNINCIDNPICECDGDDRSDNCSVIFKKLVKVGEPYNIGKKVFQRYAVFVKPCIFNEFFTINTPVEGLYIGIEIKQNKEDMEEKNKAKHSNTEKIGKHLKPFNLEEAKAGKPVCTRDGRKARIICFDAKCADTPIVALVSRNDGEILLRHYKDGKLTVDKDSDADLMMLSKKKEGWVNVYRDEESKRVYCGEFIFSEREKAEKHYECNDTKVATVPVNWEE